MFDYCHFSLRININDQIATEPLQTISASTISWKARRGKRIGREEVQQAVDRFADRFSLKMKAT
jgi:hypothetical protein